MRCSRIRGRFDAYLNMEMTLQERETIETHLSECAGCREEFRKLDQLGLLLNTYEVPPINPNLTNRIMVEARLLQNSTKTSFWRDLMDSFPPLVWRTATAFMLIIGLTAGSILGWGAWQMNGKPGSNVEMNTTVATTEEIYGLDAFSGAPAGSIESAVISLVVKER